MANISIHLIARNSMGTLPDVVDAIIGQSYTDVSLRLIDNASTDGVISYLRERTPRATVIKNARNIGTAQAQNQAIRLAMQSWAGQDLAHRYVLMLENDISLEQNALREMVLRLENEPTLGAVGGKVLRMFDENIQDEALHERVQSDHIDSVGLRLTKSLELVSRGAGEVDNGQYDFSLSVFAVPDAMMLVRASALFDTRHSDEEFMDRDFFSGNEGLDMSWRLQNAGWRVEFVPTAVAYRYRGIYKNNSILQERRNKLSNRNELFILLKNVAIADALLRLPNIVFSRFYRLPDALLKSAGYYRKMAKKRRNIFINRKVGNGEIRAMIS